MSLHSVTRAAQLDGHLCPRHSRLDSLLVRVGDGDREAFAAFYGELSQTVYGMSVCSGHGPALSAQVTLDVFLHAWQQAGTYDPKAQSAWTWVRAIALDVITSQSTTTGAHRGRGRSHDQG